MSVSFSVIFEADVPPHGTLGDDTSLASRKEDMDRLAGEYGLTSLEAFESYDPGDVAGFFEGEEDEAPGMPPVQWFQAADGLNAVRALVAHLKGYPDALADPDGVLDDLARIESNLLLAERAGVRFRFAVIP
jgi:hypothetical protein